MRRIITTLKATIALSCLIAASTGGFMAGGYWTGQKMEKAALAHSCAELDPSTLAFRWVRPASIQLTMDALEDVTSTQRKPAARGK